MSIKVSWDRCAVCSKWDEGDLKMTDASGRGDGQPRLLCPVCRWHLDLDRQNRESARLPEPSSYESPLAA